MKINDLVASLNRLKVETGSLACFGCGHEHNCSTGGCAIIRKAVDFLCSMEWIDASAEVPSNGNDVLAIVDGTPQSNITLKGAYQLANYCDGEWIIDMWPEWENPRVSYWMPLPEPPREDKIPDKSKSWLMKRFSDRE